MGGMLTGAAQTLRTLGWLLSLAGLCLLAGCSPRALGVNLYERGEFDAAAPLLREAMVRDPSRADSLKEYYVDAIIKISDEQLAAKRAYNALQEVVRAQEILRDDTRLRNQRIVALAALGRGYLEANNIVQAKTQALEILRLEPGNESGRALLGDVAIKLAEQSARDGKLGEAFSFYLEYLRDYPEDRAIRRRASDLLVQQARILFRRRQQRDALKAYVQALRFSPDNEVALGEAFRSIRGNPRAMVEDYRFLIDLLPEHQRLRAAVQQSLLRLFKEYLATNQFEHATMLTKAIYEVDTERHRPDHIKWHRGRVDLIVQAHRARGELGLAINRMKQAAIDMPELAEDLRREADDLGNREADILEGLADDIQFLGHLDMALKQREAEITNPILRTRHAMMANFIHRQQESLRTARSRRSSASIKSKDFLPPNEALERLSSIVAASEYDLYLQMLDRYRVASAGSR